MYQPNKAEARKEFLGSARLFNACWKRYEYLTSHAVDAPSNLDEVIDLLDQLASNSTLWKD